MAGFPKLPEFIEKLIVKAIKEYVPATAIKELVASFAADLAKVVHEWAAKTSNTIDDKIADLFEDALTKCSPDADFLCAVIQKGEAAVVDFFRVAAARTDTKIDDAAVDILAQALGVAA